MNGKSASPPMKRNIPIVKIECLYRQYQADIFNADKTIYPFTGFMTRFGVEPKIQPKTYSNDEMLI
jgi:hypothetical protein